MNDSRSNTGNRDNSLGKGLAPPACHSPLSLRISVVDCRENAGIDHACHTGGKVEDGGHLQSGRNGDGKRGSLDKSSQERRAAGGRVPNPHILGRAGGPRIPPPPPPPPPPPTLLTTAPE